MRNLFFVLALICMSTTNYAQDNSNYNDTLKNMFEVSGSENAYKAAIKQMFQMFKQQYSDVAPDVWADLEDEFMKTSIDDLVTMLLPVYKKHMTLEDLEGLIKFYKTPVGIKFAEKTPLIMQESMAVGQEWGTKIGQEFAEKMKEKGY